VSLAAIAASMVGVPAFAQEGASQAEDATRSQGVEIVVTATRRAESAQSVPMSITAVSSEALENKAATNFFDYGSSIPNLSFGNTGLGASVSRSIAIRGISDANTTGFYIDETPVTESLDPRIVDVERIEVLRGPQGTLYGARSMGGTVRLITTQPDTEEFSGRVHGALSTTERTERPNYAVDGALNLPVVDGKVGLRVVGVYQNDAGYMTRTYGPQGGPTTTIDNIGQQETFGVSAAMLFRVGENVEITPRILYQQTKGNGYPYADVAIPNSQDPFELVPESLDQRRTFDIAETSSDKWLLGTFDVKLDTGVGTLQSASSYFRRRTSDIEDQTEFAQFAYGYADPLVNAPEFNYQVDSYTQEFRFTSDLDGPFNFVAGVFYSHTDTDQIFPPNIIEGLADATGFTGTDLNFQATRSSKQDDLSAYAEGTLEITPELKAIVGGRVYKVKSSFSAVFDGFVNGGYNVVPETSISESGVQPKASLQYEFSRGNQIYATAAKGFRPGGSNGLIPTGFGCAEDLQELGLSPEDTRFYNSDSVWSYEAGAKATLLDGRVTANLAGFRIDWSNIQQLVGLQCGFSFRGNAGTARSTGVEFELNGRLTDGLTMNLGVGYTDANFTSSPAGTNVSDGDRVPQVPEFTFNVGADYEFEIGRNAMGFLHADYRYVGDSVSVLNSATDISGKVIPRIRPSYSLVDVRGGVEFGNHEIAIFAKNLTNELVNLGDARALAAELPGRARVQINQPRTIGVEFRSRF